MFRSEWLPGLYIFLDPLHKSFLCVLTVDTTCGKGLPQPLSPLPDVPRAPRQHCAWPSWGLRAFWRRCSTLSASLRYLVPCSPGQRAGESLADPWSDPANLLPVYGMAQCQQLRHGRETNARGEFPKPWGRSAVALTFGVWQRAF